MWTIPNPEGDAVDRFYAQELAVEMDGRTRTLRRARRVWDIYNQPWKSLADLAATSNQLAQYWLPYIYNNDVHGAVLREIATVVKMLNPERVLDVGCGVGFDACFLAGQFPEIHFAGTDISEKMLLKAKQRAERLGLQNLWFKPVAHNNLRQKLRNYRFDLIYAHGSLVFRDVEKLHEHMRGITGVLYNGGTLLIEMPSAVDASIFANIVTELFDFGLCRHPTWGPCHSLRIKGREVCWIMGLTKED